MTREQELLDIIRKLEDNDPTFKDHLKASLIECLGLMLERGEKYNGSGVPLMEHMFDEGDCTAYHNAKRPMTRMKSAVRHFGEVVPDEDIKDPIVDQLNYDLGWLCCRARRSNGNQAP